MREYFYSLDPVIVYVQALFLAELQKSLLYAKQLVSLGTNMKRLNLCIKLAQRTVLQYDNSSV